MQIKSKVRNVVRSSSVIHKNAYNDDRRNISSCSDSLSYDPANIGRGGFALIEGFPPVNIADGAPLIAIWILFQAIDSVEVRMCSRRKMVLG